MYFVYFVYFIRVDVSKKLVVKFSFSLSLAPPFIINHPEKVNCCNFLFVSAFVGDFGRELSCKRAARL